MAAPVLVVDDEPNLRRVLAAQLQREGYSVSTAEDGDEARTLLRRADPPFQCVLTDLQMPGTDGMALLRWCSRYQPDVPVVVITAHGTVDSAVEALKAGAFDFITKPFDREEIRAVVAKSLAQEAANRKRLAPANPDEPVQGIIGESAQLKDLFRLVRKVAASPTSLLLRGESGTGKELVATALHRLSDRASKPLIKVNCTAIPESLFESELFGHEKGSFTGALASKPGRFELADGGTFFLDEVGELPLPMQAKLLRVLQERSFERVGGLSPINVDVRLIAATNAPLEDMVAKGTFREDLLFRLNVVELQLPPLRDRPSDIPLLVEHFITKFNERLGRQVVGLVDGVLVLMERYPWPGNVRELENMLERAVLLSDNERLQLEDFPALALSPRTGDGSGRERPDFSDVELDGNLKELVRTHSLEVEQDLILRALAEDGWNVTRAARRLGISRKSLQVKMKEYGLRRNRD